jgi:hypothetical protein
MFEPTANTTIIYEKLQIKTCWGWPRLAPQGTKKHVFSRKGVKIRGKRVVARGLVGPMFSRDCVHTT